MIPKDILVAVAIAFACLALWICLRWRIRSLGISLVVLVVLIVMSTSVVYYWSEASERSNMPMRVYAAERWGTLLYGDLLERESRRIAGPNAVNCGYDRVEEDSDKVDACVLRAVREKQPFRARYKGMGVDYYASTGIASAAHGDVYLLSFAEGPFVPLNFRLRTLKCAQPVSLEFAASPKVWGSRISCMPQ